MYTTTIGRTFLKAYNTKFKKGHTAKSFFEEEFIPLFFDHPKYMMTAGNSPLENPKLSWDDMIKGKKPFETPERRRERISKMIRKIESEKADNSIAIGYGVLDNTSATTGQATNIEFPDDKENIYFSWIGAGLGIGVTGGLNILFNHEQLLLDIFEGWQYYREYLERTPLLKGNQINTWNGNWIVHRYDKEYDPADPAYEIDTLEATNNGLYHLQTSSWVEVLWGIASKNQTNNLVGYLYSIGQTNTTIGFIPFKLQDLIRPCQLYERIFGNSIKSVSKMSKLYGTAKGLNAACMLGSIGIAALEPKGLKAFLPTEKKEMKKIVYKGDEEQTITYNTYLIWILAMLNNEELWNTSRQFAELLLEYEANAGKTRSNRVNNVKELLTSTGPEQFLQRLIPILEEDRKRDEYEKMGKTVHNMPRENLRYFNTLIRFQYALLNK